MPVTQGAMPEWQLSKIKRNFRYLKNEIDAKELQDHFVEAEIFDFPDLDAINGYNPDTKENRNNCFFRLMRNAGPKAYDVFLYALRKNGQEYVAERLEETVPSQQACEADYYGKFCLLSVYHMIHVFYYILSCEILEFPSVINFDIITSDDINFYFHFLP